MYSNCKQAFNGVMLKHNRVDAERALGVTKMKGLFSSFQSPEDFEQNMTS